MATKTSYDGNLVRAMSNTKTFDSEAGKADAIAKYWLQTVLEDCAESAGPPPELLQPNATEDEQ